MMNLKIAAMIGAALLAATALIGSYVKGRVDGRAAVLERIAGDRITLLKDGKRIDDEVLAADDDALCALIGGCELHGPADPD